MGITTYQAIVREHELLTNRFQYVDFELAIPSRIQFKAGQFLMMKIPGVEQRRCYSIASAPEQDHSVEILVDIAPQGDGSLFIASLSPGDEVEFMAPAGNFGIADPASEIGKQEEKLIFVATGSGVAPMRSMALDLLQTKKDKREIFLHWGLRFSEDVFWEEDFREMSEFFPNFHFDLALSKPSVDWPFCSGHVNYCVEGHHKDFSKAGVYLCGNEKMIAEMQEFLAKKGLAKEQIHVDLWKNIPSGN